MSFNFIFTREQQASPGAASERLRDLLHAKSLHATSAREEVAKPSMAREGHFDIDELAADLRAHGVSKSSLYRALPLLMEAGIVQPAVLSGEHRRYEAALGREHHDHLICSRCGAVVEFQFEAFEALQREVATKYGYRLTPRLQELLGICPGCEAKQSAGSTSNG